jgi:diguanylate cyclase (GGDEF)-like protein
LTVGRKLACLAGVGVALAVVLSAVAYASVSSLDASNQKAAALAKATTAVVVLNRDTQLVDTDEMVLATVPTNLAHELSVVEAEYTRAISAAQAQVAAVRSLRVSGPAVAAAVDQAETYLRQASALTEQLVANIPGSAAGWELEEAQFAHASRVTAAGDSARSFLQAASAAATRAADSEASSVRAEVLVAALAGLAVLVAVSTLIARSVTSRVRRAADALSHVAAGDYTVSIDAHGTDEIGEMSRSLRAAAAAHEALSYQAFHDTLTGLPNRALFLDRLGQELARRERGGPGIAVLFLDLDRFKIVNDSLGHGTGDTVLKELGGRFIRGVRAGETAARFSGDEFLFIIRDINGAQDAVSAAKRLQSLLEAPVRCEGHDLTVTGSVGIVVPAAQADAATVLRDADAAMYQAKEGGRNRYALFDEAMHGRSVARFEMEGELRRALARNELEVYYQPVVEPTSGLAIGAEALVRWDHPSRGLVPPLEFVPVAEESGLIRHIGRWVFEQAVAQLASWDADRAGPRLDLLAVNLSARQLDDPETPDIVAAVLDRYGAAPGRVCLEVTESVVMLDNISTRRSLEAFKDLGLRVAIDDFGTGYSSLAHLHALPVTTLKVDRSFVERLGGGDDSTPVVRAVIEMAHAMGLSVVAEGVSSERLRDLVSALGCDSAQGFYWSPPLPAADFACWWREAEGAAELGHAGVGAPGAREPANRTLEGQLARHPGA